VARDGLINLFEDCSFWPGRLFGILDLVNPVFPFWFDPLFRFFSPVLALILMTPVSLLLASRAASFLKPSQVTVMTALLFIRAPSSPTKDSFLSPPEVSF